MSLRKKISLIGLFCLLSLSSMALNDSTGINFIKQESFEEILRIAKKENKLVFIDAYTTWCGPCKWMDKNVFPDPEVGEVFNQHFVSAKFDMEKGEGLELAKKYGVSVYPTFLFVDAGGELVHRICGSSEKEDFIKRALVALDENNRLATYEKKYRAGERKELFLRDYLAMGKSACQDMKEIAEEFWKLIPDRQLSEEKNWEVFKATVNDINSREFQYLISNLSLFKSELDSFSVNAYVEEKIYYGLAAKYRGNDTVDLQDEIDTLISHNSAPINKGILKFKIWKASQENSWMELANLLLEYKEQVGLHESGYITIWAIKIYEAAEDLDALKKAADVMENVISEKDDPHYDYLNTYASLLLKSGQIEKGKKAALQAIDVGKKEGSDYSETEALLQKYQ